MDRLKAMEVFVHVVEQGSFTAAARTLRLPKASATTHVQALEAHVGAKLLHRTTRRVSPTLEGSMFYEHASRMLRELDEIEGALGRASASPGGRLRVDVPAASGRHLIAPAIPAFLERYPGLVVELGSTDRPVDLLGEGVDCVVRGGDLHEETMISRKLGELPVLTCAAPSHLARHGTPRTPEELARHPFVNFFSAKTGRVFEVELQRGERQVSFLPAHRVAANDADTWIQLAVDGLGIVQAPCSSRVREHLSRGELRVVLPGWTAPALPMFVLYPPTPYVPARVRAFVDWVVELYREECDRAARFVKALERPGRRRRGL